MNDKYIFSGNRNESVPRALFLDQRLTPLERNAWQVIRMMLESDDITAIPTYDQLQPFLTSMPLSGKASTETVARALIILRLTRWLTLALKRRNKNGAVLGNVYILHDEPLTLYECLQIEPDYLVLLSNTLSHTSKAIQKVASFTLNELISDPYLTMKKLPTRLEVLTERLNQLTAEKLSTTSESEGSKKHLLRDQNNLNSESEVSLKASNFNTFRNPKSISSSKDKKILLQEIQRHLKLPERFLRLSLSQQQISLLALSTLSQPVQQQVLDEWQQRCDIGTIHKPAAYLHGIIQKALQGELNLLNDKVATEIKPEPIIPNPPIEPVSNSVDRQQVQAYLAEIKNMLRIIPTARRK